MAQIEKSTTINANLGWPCYACQHNNLTDGDFPCIVCTNNINGDRSIEDFSDHFKPILEIK